MITLLTSRLKSFRACQRGAAMIEFALTGVLLVVFLMGLVNLGLLGFSLGALNHAVQVAARTATVQTVATYSTTGAYTCPVKATVLGYFNQVANPPLPAAGTAAGANPKLTVTWTDNGPGKTTGEPPALYLTLNATYNFVPIGLTGFKGFNLNATTVATVMSTNGVTTSCAGS
jgi:Flp pilus assembly protein TadG